jgi:hypothetical protein
MSKTSASANVSNAFWMILGDASRTNDTNMHHSDCPGNG